jgi:hypothetical protein
MATLRVRVYNVLFGDAILLSIPELDAEGREITLHVLIDIGNAMAGSGGDDSIFAPVLANIQAELAGAPLDLYVMTHEHMDHVQGLLYGARKLGIEIKARTVWMTASSAPDYYDRFQNARKRRSLALAARESIAGFLARSAAPMPAAIEALLAINNPRASDDCVSHIRGIGGAPPLYLHRTADTGGDLPFRRTKLRVLAPEEDTSIYYGRFAPPSLGFLLDDAAPTLLPSAATTPPAGVSAGDFFDLIRFRSSGMSTNLRTIDKAANNSSVVLELEWNGWRLLFPGDAEEKSWEIMAKLGLLRPVHFLKVSHHGSKNGSPAAGIDVVLPEVAPDRKPRQAVVSTHVGAYPGVPDDLTLDRLKRRATLYDTRHLEPGGWIDITFDA